MRPLTKFLFETVTNIFEAEDTKYIIKTPADAFEFFGVEPDSDAGKLIEYMYSIAPKNPDTETGYSSPFVGNYGSKKGFACRRWVKDNPALTEYMEKITYLLKRLFQINHLRIIMIPSLKRLMVFQHRLMKKFLLQCH